MNNTFLQNYTSINGVSNIFSNDINNSDLITTNALIVNGVNITNNGLIGPTGYIGPVGVTGPTGEIGPIGIQGIQGIQGPRGPEGDKGNKGNDGDRGPAGSNGSDGSILGLASLVALGGSVAVLGGSIAVIEGEIVALESEIVAIQAQVGVLDVDVTELQIQTVNMSSLSSTTNFTGSVNVGGSNLSSAVYLNGSSGSNETSQFYNNLNCNYNFHSSGVSTFQGDIYLNQDLYYLNPSATSQSKDVSFEFLSPTSQGLNNYGTLNMSGGALNLNFSTINLNALSINLTGFVSAPSTFYSSMGFNSTTGFFTQ